MKKADYLIIGQGLAGSMMAWHLMQAGRSVMVVDNGLPSASTVAAGLFNPVTGRRFVKSWLTEELLPYAESVYRHLESALGHPFYYKKPIIHLLAGNEERQVYEKSIKPGNRRYIVGFHSSSSSEKFSSCEITEGGFVDTHTFLSLFREFLEKEESLTEEYFLHSDLIITGKNVTWKDVAAEKVIFCEGYKATGNPFFPDLPFNLAKGEILTLKIPGLNQDEILISGCYLVPLGNDIYKLGSTYEWNDLKPEPTEKGKEELIAKLKKITNLAFEVLSHEAGVRPATVQRRPLVGRHLKYHNVFILNGMGTKGVLLAPYFANHLCEHILRGTPIDAEVNAGLLLHAGI